MKRWSPWGAVRAMPDVHIRRVELPAETGGAVLSRRGDQIWILLDRTLTSAGRRCALAHELVHLERGTSTRCRWAPRGWDVVVAREELRVDRIVADRLVPSADLAGFIDRAVAAGRRVGVPEVAGEYDVTDHVAAVALERLPQRGRIPA